MTNLGHSEFGPATGASADVVTIADCVVKGYVIVEEWLARDNLHLAQQLGIDTHMHAKAQAELAQDSASIAWRCEELERLRTLSAVMPAEYPGSPVEDRPA